MVPFLPLNISSTLLIINCLESLLTFAVQQMDVRPKTSQFSLPSIHDMYAYDCAVFPCIRGTIFPPTIPTSIRLPHQSPKYTFRCGYATASDGKQKAAHDADVLFHANWTMWSGYWVGYWTREYEFEVYYVDVL